MDARLLKRGNTTIATTRDIVRSLQLVRDEKVRICAGRKALRDELRETIEAGHARLDLITMTIDLQTVLDELHRCVTDAELCPAPASLRDR